MSQNKQKIDHIPREDLVKLYRKALKEGVDLGVIDKKVEEYADRAFISQKVETVHAEESKKRWKSKTPLIVRIFSWVVPTGFLGLGLFMVGSAVIPIVSYMLTTAPQLQAAQLVAPIPQEEVIDIVPIVLAEGVNTDGSPVDDEYDPGPKILDVELDYTNLSNWFDEPVPELDDEKQVSQETSHQKSNTYILDIPQIDVEDAVVTIGGTDLNKSIIQYPGTANPGDIGSPVLFGHSVLRQFYNPSPKNPNRYNSIFSTIMTLKPGDKIYVTHEGIKYTYLVRNKTEVKPEDTYILSQRNDSKLLKLVTCTPEGTYLRRGVVTAQLVE